MLKKILRWGLVSAVWGATLQAAPITYLIDFTTASGIAPTPGGFIYDAAAAPASAFADFIVHWNALILNFTDSANNHTPLGECPADADGSAVSFSILAGTIACGPEISRVWRFAGTGIDSFSARGTNGLAYIGALGSGPSPNLSTGAFTIAAVPEPGGAVLTIIGMVTLGWAVGRKADEG